MARPHLPCDLPSLLVSPTTNIPYRTKCSLVSSGSVDDDTYNEGLSRLTLGTMTLRSFVRERLDANLIPAVVRGP